MSANRRTLWLGAALIAVLVVAAVVWTSGGASDATGRPTRARPPARTQEAASGASETAQAPAHVQLDALKVQRSEPGDAERDPFRFQSRAPARAPEDIFAAPKPGNQSGLAPTTPPVPTGPPPPPPIPLKFIGTVEQGGKRVAVLSDGRSSPQYGVEGAIILGQYRILKIGAESIEMAYLDGRGRQTIRLTGQ